MKIKVCGYELDIKAVNQIVSVGEEEDTKYFLNRLACWLHELSDIRKISSPALAEYYSDEAGRIHDRLAGLGFYDDVREEIKEGQNGK